MGCWGNCTKQCVGKYYVMFSNYTYSLINPKVKTVRLMLTKNTTKIVKSDIGGLKF